MEGNQISQIDNMCDITSLTSLDLSKNALARLPITLSRLTRLKYLVLSPLCSARMSVTILFLLI